MTALSLYGCLWVVCLYQCNRGHWEAQEITKGQEEEMQLKGPWLMMTSGGKEWARCSLTRG